MIAKSAPLHSFIVVTADAVVLWENEVEIFFTIICNFTMLWNFLFANLNFHFIFFLSHFMCHNLFINEMIFQMVAIGNWRGERWERTEKNKATKSQRVNLMKALHTSKKNNQTRMEFKQSKCLSLRFLVLMAVATRKQTQ